MNICFEIFQFQLGIPYFFEVDVCLMDMDSDNGNESI